MQIEYTEDESRIRWEWHGEWHEADLDDLIMAYETESYWDKYDCITMRQEDFDALIERVMAEEQKDDASHPFADDVMMGDKPKPVWSEEWTRQ